MNRAELWQSDGEWNLKNSQTNELLVYIENVTEGTVLTVAEDETVVLRPINQDDQGQLWKMGEPDEEEYFRLFSPNSKKLMTVVTPTELKMKGMWKYCEKEIWQLGFGNHKWYRVSHSKEW